MSADGRLRQYIFKASFATEADRREAVRLLDQIEKKVSSGEIEHMPEDRNITMSQMMATIEPVIKAKLDAEFMLLEVYEHCTGIKDNATDEVAEKIRPYLERIGLV